MRFLSQFTSYFALVVVSVVGLVLFAGLAVGVSLCFALYLLLVWLGGLCDFLVECQNK